MSKVADRNQRQLLELLKAPGNDLCADCRSKNPRWASWDQGVFICVQCAGIHRKMGTHISKVKSLTLDTWSREQVEHMKSTGNIKSNAILNPDEHRNPPPSTVDEGNREHQLERFIRRKYETREFVGATPSRSPAPTPAPAPAPAVRLPPPTSTLSEPLPAPTARRRAPSPLSAAHMQATRSATLPLSLPSSSYPSPTPPPHPTTIDRPLSATITSSPERKVRFRASSVPVSYDEDDPPSRSPSALGTRAPPAKSILRPRSSLSSSQSSTSSVSAQPVPTLPEGFGLGRPSTLGGLANGQRSLSNGSSMSAQAGQRNISGASVNSFASAFSNLSVQSTGSTGTFMSANGGYGSSSPFGNAPSPQPPTTYAPTTQYLPAQSYTPSYTAPSYSPAPSMQPPAPSPAPPRLQPSIWDDLDSLGGLASPAAPSPFAQAPPTSILPSQQPSYAPPAPLRPQQTGFIPSSAFGQQLAQELPGGGAASPAPFLRPQQTGYYPPSQPQQQSFAASPSLSIYQPPQPSHSPFTQQPQQPVVSTNPFHASMFTSSSTPTTPSYTPSPQPHSYLAAQHPPPPTQTYSPQPPYPQQQQPQQTNPFFANYVSPQATGYPGMQQQQQQQVAMGTNPFFVQQGYGAVPSQQQQRWGA